MRAVENYISNGCCSPLNEISPVFSLHSLFFDMDTFEITRLYADTNGHSHFERLIIPLHSAGSIGFVSEAEEVESIIFRKVLPEYDYDFHQAPTKQYIILLDGKIEIETSLGEKRNFIPGDIILVEDTSGKGHRTKNLLPAIRKSVFVTLK